MDSLAYLVNYNLIFDSCEFIIITNSNNKIVKILNPYEDNNLQINKIECEVHGEHKIGENINTEKCNKFPNEFKIFNFKNDVYMHLAKLGNRTTWAGHKLRISSDEDRELHCVYNDIENVKKYAGWVATHQHRHLSFPRIMKLNAEENIQDTIDILVDEDKETRHLIVEYGEHKAIGYHMFEFVPEVMEEIKQRLGKYM
jgi:hypothetical protein